MIPKLGTSTVAPSSPARADKIRRAAKAIRGLAGARETPKFTLIRCFGLLREALDASAAELTQVAALSPSLDTVAAAVGSSDAWSSAVVGSTVSAASSWSGPDGFDMACCDSPREVWFVMTLA